MATWVQRFERVAAHEGRGRAGDAQREQHGAVEVALADRVVAVVGQEDGFVGAHGDAVSAGVKALAPGAQEVAVGVEHNHRMFAAVEHVDVVAGVASHRGALLEPPPVGQLAPALGDLVPVLAFAQYDHFTASLSVDFTFLGIHGGLSPTVKGCAQSGYGSRKVVYPAEPSASGLSSSGPVGPPRRALALHSSTCTSTSEVTPRSLAGGGL